MTIHMENFKRKYIHVKNVYVIKEVSENYEPVHLNTPVKVARYIHDAFKNLDDTKEHFLSISLNTQNIVIALNVISIGSIDMSIVHPREVFYSAIADKATAILLCHNHPSGEVTPSPNDVTLTQKLVEAGKIMGIDVYDHIIIGNPVMKDKRNFMSFKEENLI